MIEWISSIFALFGTLLVTLSTNKKSNIWGMLFWIISSLLAIYYFAFMKISVGFCVLQILYVILLVRGIYIRLKYKP